MKHNTQPRQFLDTPSALLSDKNQSLICTLKIDSIQQIEDHLCIVGWSTKPLKIHIKDKNKWKECTTMTTSRSDVEASINAKPGSNLGFIAYAKKISSIDTNHIKLESIEDKSNIATITDLDLREDSAWREKLCELLMKNNLVKKRINYKTNKKNIGHHPEGHGHLEIARKSRSYDDLVIIGWLSAKEDDLFFIETDDNQTIPITESFRFFRQDIENTGLSASHGKIKEKAGFILHLKSASKINNIQLCGIHNEATILIHEIKPELVNESGENSIEWASNIVHTEQEEFADRLKRFQIPYEYVRLQKIRRLLSSEQYANITKKETEITTIIIANDYWKTKSLITSLAVNNSIKNQYIILFNNKDEETKFTTYHPSLREGFGIHTQTITTSSTHETAQLNLIIEELTSDKILIINDNVSPNQPDFLKNSIKKLDEKSAFAIVPRQRDIYGEEYSAYIEVSEDTHTPEIKHRKTYFDNTPEAFNKAYNLDCIIFDRKKLVKFGGIDALPAIRSIYPRPMSLNTIRSQGDVVFPIDVYVTNLRETNKITSHPLSTDDIKHLVYLNLI